MAGEQRTEPPTARRLRRARSEGDHPVSRVLVSFGALAAVALLLPAALGLLVRRTRTLLEHSLQLGASRAATLSGEGLSAAGHSLVQLVALLLGPAALAALVVGLWQTGAGLSLTPLAWSSRRLDPLANLGRLWSRTLLLSLLRWLATGMLLALIGWQVLRSAGPALAASIGSVQAATALAGRLCYQLLWGALALLALASAVDALVVRSSWLERLRMTRAEVQREQRENDGDAGLKQARQRAHRELSRSARLAELPRATLLVLGRPRLATALSYDAAQDAAPRILMHASGQLAQTLEALAPAYGVAIHEDLELARALSALQPDDPIPSSLYATVAAAIRAARG
ncbi:MAG TPA: EscU/YscU/HrcU family type III secretion system export apparatus switch protein [Polyangiaceae bacterium]|nr:EscU/YscU/HrcU family type III secretion system export apparatus switch protein [Polyangiaceae bacterium]